jgi:hypothetical protein
MDVGLRRLWRQDLWFQIGKEKPVDREVDAPGHQATCNTKRQHKQRDITHGKTLEHANRFPIGRRNTLRRFWFQKKSNHGGFKDSPHGVSVAKAAVIESGGGMKRRSQSSHIAARSRAFVMT